MVRRKEFDKGRDIDWGRTSEDYAKYRPGPPQSLYNVLKGLGIGVSGQKVLDQGTGTGVFARQLAQQGCDVVGTDISSNQVNFATDIAKRENLKNIKFLVSPAEDNPFDGSSFDIVSASQCFVYFKLKYWISEIKRILKSDGRVVITFFHWLPLTDPISGETEKLVLKHNPDWSAHSLKGQVNQNEDWFAEDFNQEALIVYDEKIEFTREIWRGRIRALRGIGATLNDDEIRRFDIEHNEMLEKNLVINL